MARGARCASGSLAPSARSPHSGARRRPRQCMRRAGSSPWRQRDRVDRRGASRRDAASWHGRHRVQPPRRSSRPPAHAARRCGPAPRRRGPEPLLPGSRARAEAGPRGRGSLRAREGRRSGRPAAAPAWPRGTRSPFPWAELAIVTVACFGLFTLAAILSLIRGPVPVYTIAKTTRTILFEVGSAVLIGAFLAVRGWKWRDFRIRISIGNIVISILLAFGYIVGGGFVYSILFALFPILKRAPGLPPQFAVAWPLLLTFLIINSFFEELFVTGYIVQALERQSVRHVVLSRAGLRTLYHVYQGPVSALVIFGVVVMFATIYLRSRGLGIPICSHTAINALSSFLFRKHGG